MGQYTSVSVMALSAVQVEGKLGENVSETSGNLSGLRLC